MLARSKMMYRGEHLIVTLCGEVDMYAAPQLRKELNADIDSGVSSLIVNMRDLQYMDSSGIAMFASIQRKMKVAGGSLILLAMTKDIKRVLQIVALDSYFRVIDHLGELDT